MILILGAGLAGLSAAWHLDGQDRLVVERAPEVGGLCRSIRERGFTFDYTGHLLHLRDPTIRDWALELLPDGYVDLHRSAWIHSYGKLTPYPFQANTAGLPLDVRLECLLGFIDTLEDSGRPALPVPEAVGIEGAPPFLRVPRPAQSALPARARVSSAGAPSESGRPRAPPEQSSPGHRPGRSVVRTRTARRTWRERP